METTTVIRTRLFVGLETAENQDKISSEEVKNEISKFVSAGTFYSSEGLWKNEREESLVFETMAFRDGVKTGLEDLMADMGLSDPVECLKKHLEREFDQDSVLVERSDVKVVF